MFKKIKSLLFSKQRQPKEKTEKELLLEECLQQCKNIPQQKIDSLKKSIMTDKYVLKKVMSDLIDTKTHMLFDSERYAEKWEVDYGVGKDETKREIIREKNNTKIEIRLYYNNKENSYILLCDVDENPVYSEELRYKAINAFFDDDFLRRLLIAKENYETKQLIDAKVRKENIERGLKKFKE